MHIIVRMHVKTWLKVRAVQDSTRVPMSDRAHKAIMNAAAAGDMADFMARRERAACRAENVAARARRMYKAGMVSLVTSLIASRRATLAWDLHTGDLRDYVHSVEAVFTARDAREVLRMCVAAQGCRGVQAGQALACRDLASAIALNAQRQAGRLPEVCARCREVPKCAGCRAGKPCRLCAGRICLDCTRFTSGTVTRADLAVCDDIADLHAALAGPPIR